MTSAELLADAFDRIRQVAARLLDGLTDEQLATRPEPGANTIGWLVWHLARVQDDHVAEVAGGEQVWTAAGWEPRFGLPFDVAEIGYGQSAAEVGKVRVAGELLAGYLAAVCERSIGYVRTLADADLDRVVDERWDPPVTLGVRLVSVVSDDLQHAGQAAYVRGLLERAAR